MNTKIPATVYGAMRIRCGRVLHPARKDRYGVTALCDCPNTKIGFGIRGGKFVELGTPTCKGTEKWLGDVE